MRVGKRGLQWTLVVGCILGMTAGATADPVRWLGNGHYYEVATANANTSAVPFSRIDAYEYAQDRGGHLATITSSAENLFITRLPGYSGGNDQHIIGGVRNTSSSPWNWITGESFSYSNFGPISGEYPQGYDPDNIDGTGLMIGGKGGGWYPILSQERDFYSLIVEYDQFDPSEPPPPLATPFEDREWIRPPGYPWPGAPVQDKLVLVTHGWTRDGRVIDDTQKWVDEMVDAIADSDEWQLGSEWSVQAFHWEQEAATGGTLEWDSDAYVNAEAALNIGRQLGAGLGEAIQSSGYKEAHLIAHSAGAALIQAAIDRIRLREALNGVPVSERMVIHATFLDGFQGQSRDGAEWYGEQTNWSDNYWVSDIARFTEGPYKHAYNVDLGERFPSVERYRGHGGPYRFYLDSAFDFAAADDIGVQLSREADSAWSETGPIGPYGVGNGYDGKPDVIWNSHEFGSGDILASSSTGVATLVGNTILLETESPAWLTLAFAVTSPVNFISFRANFTSAADARGVLSVSWNGSLIGFLDELYAAGGRSTWSFGLPQVFGPGEYALTLRLDSYSAVPSSVSITDFQSRLATDPRPIPEPLTLATVGLGFGLLAWRMRRRKKAA